MYRAWCLPVRSTTSLQRRLFTSSSRQLESDVTSGRPFSAIYEPAPRVRGPLGSAGVSPRFLKKHLDRFVVGQDRAKKVLSVAMFNHYLRVREIRRREEERDLKLSRLGGPFPQTVEAQLDQKQEANATATESSVSETILERSFPIQEEPAEDPTARPILEKSNVLMLGPTGVGKTLLAKTLADALDVPFSISDCTPFTQAGYIGEDADVCISRLLAAANYDVERAEHGVVVLDEVDKLAARRVTGGRDVSGEGVQQALLKIIEGTTVQIQAKPEKSSRPNSHNGRSDNFPPGSSGPGSLTPGFSSMSPNPKGETFNIRTDNILFIFTGAFIGLHKHVLDRVSQGSIGFGAHIRSNAPREGLHENLLLPSKEDAEMFRKNIPFYTPEPALDYADKTALEQPTKKDLESAIHYPFPAPSLVSQDKGLNVLDLVTPPDLQKYGIIPELIGRIPVNVSLSPLSKQALLRVLIEPQNSLVSQYDSLFKLSGIRLRFTRAALEEIARCALQLGTGARGLRSIVEGVLADAMFEAPGSETEHVIVTKEVAARKSPAICLSGRMAKKADELIAQEERQWEREWLKEHGDEKGAASGIEPAASTFDEYRNREAIGGFA